MPVAAVSRSQAGEPPRPALGDVGRSAAWLAGNRTAQPASVVGSEICAQTQHIYIYMCIIQTYIHTYMCMYIYIYVCPKSYVRRCHHSGILRSHSFPQGRFLEVLLAICLSRPNISFFPEAKNIRGFKSGRQA